MIRYEAASQEAIDLLNEVQDRHFPELKNAKIALLFDLKKRSSNNRLVLGRIVKPNDLVRHFTKDDAVNVDGFDYIVILDKVGWDVTGHDDRVRVIRHELRHTFYDIEAEENCYKLIDHSITDFYEEVELNKDDPRWKERLAMLISDIYEQKKDEGKGKKRKRGYSDIHPRQGRIDS